MGEQIQIKLILLILLIHLSACSPVEKPTETAAAPEIIPTAEPTVIPAPTLTPTPQISRDWADAWSIWVGENDQEQVINFSAEGNQITGTIEEEGETKSIKAQMSLDGITVMGSWVSSCGESGPVAMLISDDRQAFSGNLGGGVMFCGSRNGMQKPKPCFSEFGANWNGEWVVWLGPEEFEVVLVFRQDGNAVSVMLYDFDGTVSEDGRVLSGQFDEFGISGTMKAKILDNLAQFNGNMVGMAPFCGVRRGGPKPPVCFGP